MPVAQAEELKRQYGHAVVTAVPQDAEIEIANPQPRDALAAPRGRNSGAARPRALSLRARKPPPGRRARCARRRLRAHRRRRHAARHARPGREPAARAGAHRNARAPLQHARRTRQPHVIHRDRHAALRASHPRHARLGKQRFARQAARHFCSKFLRSWEGIMSFSEDANREPSPGGRHGTDSAAAHSAAR